MRVLSWLPVLLLSTVPASAAEISLLGGYRTGGPLDVPVFSCGDSPCPEPSVDARDGEAFGLILDIPFRDRLMFEILLNHQSGELEYPDLTAVDIIAPVRPKLRFDLTYLHVGLLRQWRKAKASPFAAVGIGVAQLEAERLFFFQDALEADRFSASLGGGVKVRLNDWLAIRIEGRGYWADMPDTAGKDSLQLDFSTGLSFKF